MEPALLLAAACLARCIDCDLVHERLQDAWVITAGDSFAINLPNDRRVFPRILRIWPHELSGITAGLRYIPSVWPGIDTTEADRVIYAGADDVYADSGGTPRTLPTNGYAEISTGRIGFGVPLLDDPSIGFRALVWTPDDAGPPAWSASYTIETTILPPETPQVFELARPFGASPTIAMTGELRVGVQDGSGIVLGGSAVAESRRGSGILYTSLADTSWSFVGFGEPRTPTNQFQKYIADGLLKGYLRIAHEPGWDHAVVFWYLANEEHEPGEYELLFESMIDRMRSAVLAAGLPEPVQVLVIPHLHITRFEDIDGARPFFDTAWDEAALVARRRDDVAAVSLARLTDMTAFDGRPEAEAWLRDRGYHDAADRTAGDFLDRFQLHPWNDDGVLVMGTILWDAIRRSADPGDWNGDGQKDAFDILEFFDAVGDRSLIADLVDPEGLDLFDILFFVDRFTD